MHRVLILRSVCRFCYPIFSRELAVVVPPHTPGEVISTASPRAHSVVQIAADFIRSFYDRLQDKGYKDFAQWGEASGAESKGFPVPDACAQHVHLGPMSGMGMRILPTAIVESGVEVELGEVIRAGDAMHVQGAGLLGHESIPEGATQSREDAP